MIDNTPIIDAIEDFINKEGSGYSKWYVGITDSIKRRLREEHNVPENTPWWIYQGAVNKEAAEMIEKYFIDQGCKGAPGGGNDNSKIIYAYLITNTTKE